MANHMEGRSRSAGEIGLATKKAQKRRDEIISAARILFMDRPYEAVSITDLERATGLTRGPIYYYFKGKEEIYAAIVVDGLRQIEQDIAAMAERCSDLQSFIGALVQEHEDIYEKDKALFDIHFRFFFGRQNAVQFPQERLAEIDEIISRSIGTITQFLRNAAADGVVKCPDPHFAALSIWGMMVTTLQMDSESVRFRSVGRPRAELVASVKQQILAMLGFDSK